MLSSFFMIKIFITILANYFYINIFPKCFLYIFYICLYLFSFFSLSSYQISLSKFVFLKKNSHGVNWHILCTIGTSQPGFHKQSMAERKAKKESVCEPPLKNMSAYRNHCRIFYVYQTTLPLCVVSTNEEK